VEQTKSTDVVIGLSLDELVAQVGENSGVLVDPAGISMTLEPRVLEEAMKVRSEKRVIFRPQPAQQPAAQEEAKADQATETPATPTAQEESQEATHEVEPSDEVNPSDEEKPGFFSRIFGGK
jgi:ribosomal protein L12E/L44/L45/RPP1/RPP2